VLAGVGVVCLDHVPEQERRATVGMTKLQRGIDALLSLAREQGKQAHEREDDDDERRVADVAAQSRIDVSGARVLIDDVDVTRAIRTPEIDRAATAVARLPGVRAVLVERQRVLGDAGGVVMEGRDIGTVVFPEAAVKIYLDASPEERARRRASDPAHSGSTQVAEVATLITARDEIDRTRTASPLYAAGDAVIVDTTGKTVDEVVRRVLDVIADKLNP